MSNYRRDIPKGVKKPMRHIEYEEDGNLPPSVSIVPLVVLVGLLTLVFFLFGGG